VETKGTTAEKSSRDDGKKPRHRAVFGLNDPAAEDWQFQKPDGTAVDLAESLCYIE